MYHAELFFVVCLIFAAVPDRSAGRAPFFYDARWISIERENARPRDPRKEKTLDAKKDFLSFVGVGVVLLLIARFS